MLLPRSLKNPETLLLTDLDLAGFALFFFGLAACGAGVTAGAATGAAVAALPLELCVELLAELADGVGVPAGVDEPEELAPEPATTEMTFSKPAMG